MPTTSRRRDAPDLPIRLDRAIRSHVRQVHEALRAAILDGRLKPGSMLPSSRALADQVGVRRNAVVAAYEHLASDGLIEARHGAGTFVASQLPVKSCKAPQAEIAVDQPPRGPFALGHTFVDTALLQRLASAMRRRIVTATADDLGYGDPRGSLHLRMEIARALGMNRGIQCDADCIMVVSGTQHGLRLCADALLSPGDAMWMEDAGYYATRATLEACGLRLVAVPVDAEGIVVTAGRCGDAGARAAYVTPSHQFPTGVTMSMRRRVALLEWAREADAWIVEDDYDSEYRFGGPPLTALAGIGGERVIYIGTFSKTLFAGLRLAYLVLPRAAVRRVMAVRASHDRFPSRFAQDAVADLMADGVLASHIRRMRPRYRDARDVVAETLEASSGGALRIAVPGQGLHLLATLPDGHARGLAEQVRSAAGVETKLLSETRIVPYGPDGFVLGYAGHEIADLRDAARRLGEAARRLTAAVSRSLPRSPRLRSS